MNNIKNKELKKTYDIQAPASEVWKALTTPEIIRKYFFGTKAVSDWKEGSIIHYTGEWEGKPYHDKAVILKMIPEKLLKLTYWSDRTGKPDIPENYSVHSYELAALRDKTQLTLMQEDGFKKEEDRSKAWQHWDIVVDGLKKIVEPANK